MTRRPNISRRAVTLDEHRSLDLDRPLTDHPLGTYTANRRSSDAMASQLVATPHRKEPTT